MNIHVVLMLLAFHSPALQDSLPLLEQPQISAPRTIQEERQWLWTIRTLREGQ